MTQTQAEQDEIAVKYYQSGRSIVLQFWSLQDKVWKDICVDPGPVWSNVLVYRIKPTKKTVPWEAKDVKPGMVFRHKNSEAYVWMIPTLVMCRTITLSGVGISFEVLAEAYLWSLDAVTWKRCEREVEE